jgi:hypothetical protein
VSQPVVLLGTGRVIEIWSPGILDTALAEASPDEETLFASLVGPAKPSTPGNPL